MQKRHILLFVCTALLGAALGRATPPINPYGLNSSGKLVLANNVDTSLLSGPITCTTAQGTGAGAAAPWSMELTDGAAFYTGAKTGQFPSALVGGRLDVNVGASALPSGASTSALQTTGNTSLSSIDTKTPALGQAAMAASSPVVIASNQSAVPVSGTFWQTTQPVSGTVTANLGTTAGGAGQLCLDSTLTGGTAKVLLYDGTGNMGTSGRPVQVSLANTGANGTPLATTAVGPVAVGSSASTYPVMTGGADGSGNARTILLDTTGRPAGDSFKFINTISNTQAKSSAGVLTGIYVTTVAASSSIILYDNTSCALGSYIASVTGATLGSYPIRANFSTGLCIAVSGGTPSVTVTYN